MKKLILYLFFLFTLILLCSQTLHVKELKQSATDMSARTNAKLGNNKPCALLRVLPAIPDAKFHSNFLVGDVEYKTNCYWAYLADGTKRIEVNVPSYLPLNIILEEFCLHYTTNLITTKIKAT